MSKTKEAKYKDLKKETNKPTVESSIEALSTQLVFHLEHETHLQEYPHEDIF